MRTKDLREDVINRLENCQDLTDKLEELDEIDDGSECIVPSYEPNKIKKPVILSVNVISSISNRRNKHEEKDFVVQVEAVIEKKTIRKQGQAWADSLLDLADDELTKHEEDWGSGGLSGMMELEWDDQANLYRGARRYDYSRMDLRG